MQNKIKLSDYGFNELQIESYAACNMACSFCPYPLKDDKTSKLPKENIQNILSQVDSKDEKLRYVTFSQFNEPLLDSRLFDNIEYAQNLGFKVLVVTNGLLLNKERNINELLRLKPLMKISLQVIESEEHKEARGINLELSRYANTIFNFCELAKDKKINITIDLGCNFSDSFVKLQIKKFLGLQTGDPSIPEDKEKLFKQFRFFINKISEQKKYFQKNESINNILDSIKDNLDNNEVNLSNYDYNKGIKLFDNIELKFKPFFYGKRIKEFYPVNNSFACNSSILGVLADGNVVPCCLAYDNSISIGNVKNKNLISMIKENKFLKDLRTKGGDKHITCKKCFGEPTKRGSVFRSIFNMLS